MQNRGNLGELVVTRRGFVVSTVFYCRGVHYILCTLIMTEAIDTSRMRLARRITEAGMNWGNGYAIALCEIKWQAASQAACLASSPVWRIEPCKIDETR